MESSLKTLNRLIFIDDYESRHGERAPKTRGKSHGPRLYTRHVIQDGKFVESDIGSRIVTIAYEWNQDAPGKNLIYGASIFRKDLSTDVFNKAHHRHTAMERMRLRPKAVRFESSAQTNYQDLRNFLRKCVHRHGVGAKSRIEGAKGADFLVGGKGIEVKTSVVLNSAGKVKIGKHSFGAEELRELLSNMNLPREDEQMRVQESKRSKRKDNGRNMEGGI